MNGVWHKRNPNAADKNDSWTPVVGNKLGRGLNKNFGSCGHCVCRGWNPDTALSETDKPETLRLAPQSWYQKIYYQERTCKSGVKSSLLYTLTHRAVKLHCAKGDERYRYKRITVLSVLLNITYRTTSAPYRPPDPPAETCNFLSADGHCRRTFQGWRWLVQLRQTKETFSQGTFLQQFEPVLQQQTLVFIPKYRKGESFKDLKPLRHLWQDITHHGREYNYGYGWW